MRLKALTIASFLILSSVLSSYGIDKKILNSAGFQELNQVAPDFSLYGLDGRMVSLKDYHGKVVILHFWATWCKPCKEEMPTIEKMHREFNNKDLVILAVSIDKGEVNLVRYYVKEFTFPILLASSSRIDDSYWSWGIPVSYLINRDGKIIGRALGPRNWDSDALKNLIKQILRD